MVRSILTLLIFAGAGAAAGVVLNATRGLIDPEQKSVAFATDEMIRKAVEEQKWVARRGSGFTCGCAAAALTAISSLAFGRSPLAAVGGAILGAIFGAAGGAGAGYFTQEYTEYAVSTMVPSNTRMMVTSAIFWIPAGLAIGLTALICGGRAPWHQRLAIPLVGGAAAAAICPILAGFVFPIDYKGRIPPLEAKECLFVGLAGGVILGLFSAFLLNGRRSSAPNPNAAVENAAGAP